MEETKHCKSERKREPQPISVPFIWEEKPGMPKKDWKPTPRPINRTSPPAKLVVSVPFGWEEKPGTPLPSYLPQPATEPAFAASRIHSITFSSPTTIPSDHDSGNNGENEEDNGSSDSELDAYSVETDDSFTSAKSLLANGLITTTAISNAVPVQETTMGSEHEQGPGSPASETESISSYATGTTSLAGASFLEWLFPLLVPSSSVPDIDPLRKTHVQGKEFLHETNYNQVGRPLLTLGELIAMSRRRSCQKKVMKVQKQQSMDFMKRNAFGCCISRIGNRLHLKWKRQLQLKLM